MPNVLLDVDAMCMCTFITIYLCTCTDEQIQMLQDLILTLAGK